MSDNFKSNETTVVESEAVTLQRLKNDHAQIMKEIEPESVVLQRLINEKEKALNERAKIRANMIQEMSSTVSQYVFAALLVLSIAILCGHWTYRAYEVMRDPNAAAYQREKARADEAELRLNALKTAGQPTSVP